MEEEQSVWVSEEQRRICKELAEHYRAIISLLGDDPDREGLRKTPERTAKAMMQLTRGYRQSAQEIISSAVFEHTGSRIVVVRDIEFYSFCEHHLLPFFGKVHVGYIPSGGIVDLSKVARLVEVFARRFQVQERLTAQICQSLTDTLSTEGVMVVVEARHLCMQMRGVEKQGAVTVTYDSSGKFEQEEWRREFYSLIGKNSIG